MRRQDREITDRGLIEAILREAIICRVAMVDNGRPYVVPMNYVYHDGCLYLHSAKEGRKIDVLRRNPTVCFEVEARVQVVPPENGDDWSMRYLCVIGEGQVSFVEDFAEKGRILRRLLGRYSGEENPNVSDGGINAVAVLRIDVADITGKKNKVSIEEITEAR